MTAGIMLDVPPTHETLVLLPAGGDERSGTLSESRWPCQLAFALTAFDTPCVQRTRTDNVWMEHARTQQLRGTLASTRAVCVPVAASLHV